MGFPWLCGFGYYLKLCVKLKSHTIQPGVKGKAESIQDRVSSVAFWGSLRATMLALARQ